jgi:hypothetical protein
LTLLPPNFLIQPRLGLTESKRGLSDAQLQAYESKIGFKLPESYKALLRAQNGGSTRYGKIKGCEDFCFSGPFSSVSLGDEYRITDFLDYMLATCEPEEIEELRLPLHPFYPERLILFSGLDGHSAAFLDYGFRSEEPAENPGVVFISDDGDEFCHFCMIGSQFESFDAFLAALSVNEEHTLEVYLGIVANNDFAGTVQRIAHHLNLNLEAHVNDDRNGHFNFDVWHSSKLPLMLDDETLEAYAKEQDSTLEETIAWAEQEGRARKIHCIFSPNQHRAGTHLYPDHPEITVVLEIYKSWFPMQRPIQSLRETLREIPEILRIIELPEDREQA